MNTVETSKNLLLLHPDDTVLLLMNAADKGQILHIGGMAIALERALPMGHKLARRAMKTGDRIKKYGAVIGLASCDIAIGDHVHLHNLRSTYTAIEDQEA